MLETYSLMPLSSGLVQGTDIVFVLTSPGPYPSLNPSDYSITGEKGSGSLPSLTDLKMDCFSSISRFCGYPAYTAPTNNKYETRLVMQNIVEPVTLFHRTAQHKNFVYHQRHGVVQEFQFVAESFATIDIINDALAIASAAVANDEKNVYIGDVSNQQSYSVPVHIVALTDVFFSIMSYTIW